MGGTSAKPLVIGVTISQTDTAAGTAADVLQGFQRWAGDANHHGGLLGRPVELKVYDDASNPQNAGYKTVALLVNDSPGTVEICSGLRERAKALGLTVVLDVTYPRATTAFAHTQRRQRRQVRMSSPAARSCPTRSPRRASSPLRA